MTDRDQGGANHPEQSREKEEPLEFAALMAHQLKSPVSAAGSLLQALLGEYSGSLNAVQKDLLVRANRRLEEAIETVRRMLTIAQPGAAEEGGRKIADAAALVRRTQVYFSENARARNISLFADIRLEPAYVRAEESAIGEALDALVNNALKYTPDNGNIRLAVTPAKTEGFIRISVADSGIGVREEESEKVFEPFFRAATAKETKIPGFGLGLVLVKAVVQAAGGRVWVEKADLGGADFSFELPRASEAEIEEIAQVPESQRMKVVIIGGVAAGPKVAAKVIRLKPDTEVTIIEKGSLLSYAGCGLPYYVAGVVKEQKELLATPLGVVRDPVFFQNLKNVNVLNRTEAMEIDRAGKRVRVKNLVTGLENWISYDKLVIATGSGPIIPSRLETKVKNVFTLHGVRDAEGIRSRLAEMKARDVVIVGGGLIGVEMTEALVARGCRVTILEMTDQILGILDWEMAALLEHHLESQGVRVLKGAKALSFAGDEWVTGVVTERETIPADMVILAVGIRPNVDLARKAGLTLGVNHGIKVDAYMRTSDPNIYAAGDCVETCNIVTNHPWFVPLGSTANKQGRVAAINLCGGRDVFPGVAGTTVCKVFDYCVARTGLTEKEARKAGFDVVTVLSGAKDREHFMPNAQNVMLKLVVDRKERELLGAQCVGPGHGDKRIDVAATAITSGMKIDEIANLDIGYAPAYSLAIDNLLTAANIARNKLDGVFEGVTPMEVHRMIREKEDFILLDVGSPKEHDESRIPGSILIPLGSLRGRMSELPMDKEIVTLCTSSIRGYEAALNLKAAGFRKVRVMDGGVMMWPYEKISGGNIL